MIKMRRVRFRPPPKRKRRWWPGGLFMLIGLVYLLTGEGLVPHMSNKHQPPVQFHWRATPGWTRIVGAVVFFLGTRSVFRKRKE